MTPKQRQVILVSRDGPKDLFSIPEIAIRCGVNESFVERLYRSGIIDPYPGSEHLFAPAVTVLVRKVYRLQTDLGVNPEGAAIILDLMKRIELLQNQLRKFTKDV